MRERYSSSRSSSQISTDSCLRFVSALFSARRHCEKRIPRRLVPTAPQSIDLSSFLLPCGMSRDPAQCAVSHLSICCVTGLFRSRNTNLFVVHLILGFNHRMSGADNFASKLCADKPRHAQVRRLSAVCLRSTWQEEGSALPVASPPCRRMRRMETLPVSTPSGLCAANAFCSWAVRP
jgi:hypothetical protein